MATLDGTLPETQAAYSALSQYAQGRGITVDVADFGGLRTEADTATILNYRSQDYAAALRAGTIRPDTTIQQFRPIAPWLKSYHDYGAAFDLVIVARPAVMSDAGALQILGSAAPSFGLRWGGTFTIPDPPHFELAISLSTAQQRYAAWTSAAGPSPSDSSTSTGSDYAALYGDDVGGSGGDLAAAATDGQSGWVVAGALGAVVLAIWYALRYSRR